LEIEVLLVRLRTILLLKKVGNTFQTLIFYDCAVDSDGIFFISQHHQAHNQLGTPGVTNSFLRGAQFFYMSNTFLRGVKSFPEGTRSLSPP